MIVYMCYICLRWTFQEACRALCGGGQGDRCDGQGEGGGGQGGEGRGRGEMGQGQRGNTPVALSYCHKCAQLTSHKLDWMECHICMETRRLLMRIFFLCKLEKLLIVFLQRKGAWTAFRNPAGTSLQKLHSTMAQASVWETVKYTFRTENPKSHVRVRLVLLFLNFRSSFCWGR